MRSMNIIAITLEFLFCFLVFLLLFIILLGEMLLVVGLAAVTAIAGTVAWEIVSGIIGRKMFERCIRKVHELAEKEDEEDAE